MFGVREPLWTFQIWMNCFFKVPARDFISDPQPLGGDVDMPGERGTVPTHTKMGFISIIINNQQ